MEDKRDVLKLWLWLTSKTTINSARHYKLYVDFGSIDNIYNATKSDYTKYNYLNTENIEELCDKTIDFENLLSLYENNSVTLLSIDMPQYPELLKEIASPPVLIYCRGKFIDLNKNLCIAVVGTRQSSPYGESNAYNFSKELAQNGIVIVSGMALGIDTKAHMGALAANMPTVAIIGCGVNMVYPKSNARLMKQIIETGMVISEYPLNSQPERHHFPERNRIISGLCMGTLVIEADIKSGSLITAKYAYEQGRDVFAVPGNINSVYAKGTNYLLKDGAIVTTCAEDVISNYRSIYDHLILNGLEEITARNTELNSARVKSEKVSVKNDAESNDDFIENKILNVLTDEPIHIDTISELSGIDIKDVNSRLLCMELSNQIKGHPGKCYSRINEKNE